MKILVVSQFYYPEQFRINDICEELVRRDCEVTVLTGLPNYPEGKVNKEYFKAPLLANSNIGYLTVSANNKTILTLNIYNSNEISNIIADIMCK